MTAPNAAYRLWCWLRDWWATLKLMLDREAVRDLREAEATIANERDMAASCRVSI